jgi:uncharacterized protein (DUF952 family)
VCGLYGRARVFGPSFEKPRKFNNKFNNKRLQERVVLESEQDSEQVVKIYKICPASAWREAERQGAYQGSADDARDGFIHFSTAAQVPETLRKHFFGLRALFLVEVDGDALGDALRWEPSRNNELFPHLYGELDLGAVISVTNLNMRSDGNHDIPELAP